MPATSFTLAVLKPEIASGFYNFVVPTTTTTSLSQSSRDGSDPSEEAVDEAAEGDATPLSQRSSIAGVSAVEAALLLPNGEILTKLFARIAQPGFVVQQSWMLQFTKAQVHALYAHEHVTRLNHDETQFSAFLEHFTRGPSLALLLALPESTHCDDAIVMWQRLVGNTDPVLARQDALSSSLPHDEWPLHALCRLNSIQNGIQSSVNLDCFYRERFAVFPPSPVASPESMTFSVVVLLPTFLSSWPEGKARLVAQLNAGGVVVTKTIEDYLVSSSRGHKLLLSELHPSTNDQLGEEYTQQLHDSINGAGVACLLVLEGLDLVYTLREILGPSSLDSARVCFPESIRAQLQSPFPCVAHVKTNENTTPCLETGLFVTFDAHVSATKQPLATIVAANRIAHTPLPSPLYPPQQTLETVLIQALDVMLQCEVGNQLDVCAWLGKWLLEYTANQQDKLASDIPLKDETANRKRKAVPVKQKIADTNTQVQALDHAIQKVCADHHSVVAIVYPDNITMGTRSSMRDALQRLSTPEFVFVDVALELEAPLIRGDVESCVRAIVARLTTAGKHRFVLHDASRAFLDSWATQCGQWSVTYFVTVEPTQAVALSVSRDMKKWTPQVSYRLSATATSSTFSSFFSPIFHPTLVAVHDTQQLVSVAHWCTLANRWGFAVLAWEQLLQARITRERDPNGVFTQWQRTKANMPSEMLLTLLREAIHAAPDADNVGFSHRGGVANKFLICGFPLAACLPTSFEKHVGSIYRVVHVHNEKTEAAVSEKQDEDAWLSFVCKRGVIADLKDPSANSSLSPDMKRKDSGSIDNLTVARCFQPQIGLCIHDTNYDDTDGKLRAQIQEIARIHGFLWLDVNELTDPSASECDVIAILKRVVLRANAPSREKVLVYGFPRSNTAANAFIAAVGVPAFVIHCSSTSEATNAAELLVVWDAYPHIVQFEVASSKTRAQVSSGSSLGRAYRSWSVTRQTLTVPHCVTL